MNILLDTHAVIWYITDDQRLPNPTKSLIGNPENACFVSLVSHWEIGIKHSIGRLELGISLEELFEIIEKSGFDILPISPSHILAASTLPWHHRDPFDRLLIGQAIHEDVVLLSRDAAFPQYDALVIWEE